MCNLRNRIEIVNPCIQYRYYLKSRNRLQKSLQNNLTQENKNEFDTRKNIILTHEYLRWFQPKKNKTFLNKKQTNKKKQLLQTISTLYAAVTSCKILKTYHFWIPQKTHARPFSPPPPTPPKSPKHKFGQNNLILFYVFMLL